MPKVVVTGSRFPNDPTLNPIGATVITAEEIRNAGASNVNEAIRKVGGVFGRQNATGTQDFSLDLRGFGATSDQNMVVLVDGVRLSDNEQSIALLSTIPVELVERIEIVRGGSSVLYGDGATGGTIQVITKRGGQDGTHGTVTAEVGSYGQREVRGSVSKSWDGFTLDANLGRQRADNYRDNNGVKQENFGGGLQWASSQGRIGMRIDSSRQEYRLAGALDTLQQFNDNPRQTLHPNDFGSVDVDRYTLFAERKLGAFELAAELSHREKTLKASYGAGAFQSASEYNSRGTQFSPRVRHLSAFGDLKNELVAGLDWADWSRNTNSDFSNNKANQHSKAAYVRDEIKLGNARVAAGVRREIFHKDADDTQAFTKIKYKQAQAVNAWDLQGSYGLMPGFDVFAKTGQSYRVANVDDNAQTAVPSQVLQPQISHDLEFGSSIGNANHKLTVKWFQHRLHNEIFFDPTAGAFGSNVNLDPTKRQGVEVEASTRLTSAITAKANFQHVSATFTEGANAGKEMVLVPRNIASARLNWISGGQTADVGVQWVDSQRYGGDFSNSCDAKIPSFTTVDARYAIRISSWELALAGSNLTGKNYFTNAYGACRNGIYPDAGRQLKFTARYDF
ncbi:TonB-dependent receptor family protein [Paraherbaspirillum soli]|uniref:TonB-dependent receptor family protein n=1 Tax=Paraherbaspirillum soli TaxID=631222 RepID=A0ABW0M336_9BURK